MVKVDGLESFGFARVSVTTTIHDLKTVHVQASALGTFLDFEMDRDKNLVDELRKRLRDTVPKGLQVLWDGAKDLDAFNRNSASGAGWSSWMSSTRTVRRPSSWAAYAMSAMNF